MLVEQRDSHTRVGLNAFYETKQDVPEVYEELRLFFYRRMQSDTGLTGKFERAR